MTRTDVTPANAANPAKVSAPREGWEEHYQRMAKNGDDALLDGDILSLTTWDETE